MIRVNHWATTALSASFLLLTHLIACTRVIYAQPAAEEKAASLAFIAAPADEAAMESKEADDKTKSAPKELTVTWLQPTFKIFVRIYKGKAHSSATELAGG